SAPAPAARVGGLGDESPVPLAEREGEAPDEHESFDADAEVHRRQPPPKWSGPALDGPYGPEVVLVKGGDQVPAGQGCGARFSRAAEDRSARGNRTEVSAATAFAHGPDGGCVEE